MQDPEIDPTHYEDADEDAADELSVDDSSSDDDDGFEDDHPEDAAESDDDTETSPDDEVSEVKPEAENRRRWVPISELVLEHKFWINPRFSSGLDEESIGHLASSILSQTRSDETGVYAGIDDPLEVVMIRGANGTTINLVVDGQRRTRAAQRVLGGAQSTVLVPVVDLVAEPVTWSKEVADSYLSRVVSKASTRAGLSSVELAQAAARLREAIDPETGETFTIAVIARSVGRSETWTSKMLKAIAGATPRVMHEWVSGKLTDEQFKDLADASGKEQRALLAKTISAREAGDTGRARAIAKEARELARDAKPDTKNAATATATADVKDGKDTRGRSPVVSGEQTEMPHAPPRKPVPFAVLQDVIAMAERRPPTNEVVRGIVAGVMYAAGVIDSADLPRAWQVYVTGDTPKAKVKTKATKVKDKPKATKVKDKPKATKVKKR